MAVREARVPVPVLRDDRVHSDPPSTPVSPAAVAAAAPGRRRRQVLTSLASGALAGAVAKTTIAPLDRTKISFQVSRAPYSWAAAWAFLRAVVREEGVRALWRGNSATMARIVPYSAVQFAAHEQWKRALRVDTPQSAKEHPLLHLAAGSLAGATSQSATYPLDVARARMAVAKDHTALSLRAALLTPPKKHGIKALYRGYTVTVVGVIPYAGVSFYTYETLKRKYLEKYGVPASGWTHLVLGGAAGAIAQTVSYPLDIVRRRMQTSDTGATVRHTAATVWRTEGWRGFFKGLSMNWVKGPVAVGVSFATYDKALQVLRGLYPEEP